MFVSRRSILSILQMLIEVDAVLLFSFNTDWEVWSGERKIEIDGVIEKRWI